MVVYRNSLQSDFVPHSLKANKWPLPNPTQQLFSAKSVMEGAGGTENRVRAERDTQSISDFRF